MEIVVEPEPEEDERAAIVEAIRAGREAAPEEEDAWSAAALREIGDLEEP